MPLKGQNLVGPGVPGAGRRQLRVPVRGAAAAQGRGGRRGWGADLVPQVGKAPGGWQGKLAPAETAAAAGKINKGERTESCAGSEGEL